MDFKLIYFTHALFSAYHGHTNILMDISPYKQKQMKNHKYKDFVHVITSPDPYRGKYLGYDEETGIKYANEVKSAIEEAHGNGRKVYSKFFLNMVCIRLLILVEGKH